MPRRRRDAGEYVGRGGMERLLDKGLSFEAMGQGPGAAAVRHRRAKIDEARNGLERDRE